MLRQRPLKSGPRHPTLGLLDPKLRAWIERESKHDDCSLSLTLNSVVSYVSGIPLAGKDPRPRKQHRNLKAILDNLRRTNSPITARVIPMRKRA